MQSVCAELAGLTGPVAEHSTLVGMTFGGFLHSKVWGFLLMARINTTSFFILNVAEILAFAVTLLIIL